MVDTLEEGTGQVATLSSGPAMSRQDVAGTFFNNE